MTIIFNPQCKASQLIIGLIVFVSFVCPKDGRDRNGQEEKLPQTSSVPAALKGRGELMCKVRPPEKTRRAPWVLRCCRYYPNWMKGLMKLVKPRRKVELPISGFIVVRPLFFFSTRHKGEGEGKGGQ